MYTGCILRMTITTNFNSMIYTVVITVQLTTLSIQYVQCELFHRETTTDPPGLNSSGETISPGFNVSTPDLSIASEEIVTGSDPSLLRKLSSPVQVSLDRLQNLLNDGDTEDKNKSAPSNLVQSRARRSAHSSTRSKTECPRKHTDEYKLISRKKKYDYRRDPPPYLWTFDPTRPTLRLWVTDGPNPFSWALAKFDTQENIENYRRVQEQIKARDDDIFGKLKGPVPLRHPNGTRIKVKRKYSWMGDDQMSNETMFHRKVFRDIEEYILANESVSSDESMTPLTTGFTKRIRVRTRSKYKGWKYFTPVPGVSWSPDVYVNSPHMDLFYSSEFGPAGPDTVEEYYNLPTVDYNDSIYHLPDDLSRIPDKSKYREIASRTPPREIDLFNTIKSHYDSHEQYNDYPLVTKKKPE